MALDYQTPAEVYHRTPAAVATSTGSGAHLADASGSRAMTCPQQRGVPATVGADLDGRAVELWTAHGTA